MSGNAAKAPAIPSAPAAPAAPAQGARAGSAAPAPLFSPTRFLQSAVSSVANAAKAQPRPVARSNAMDSGPWSPPTPSRMAEHDEAESAEELLGLYKSLDDAVVGHNLTSVLSAPGGSYAAKSGATIAGIFGGITSAAAGTPLPSLDHDRPLPSIIPLVTMADFKDFQKKTDTRIKNFFTRSGAGMSAGGGARAASNRVLISRQRSTKELEEDPALQLHRCYESIPAKFFDSPFDPIRDDDQVLTLVDMMHRSRASMGEDDGSDLRDEFRDQMEQYKTRVSDNLNLVEQCLFAQTTAKADTIFQTVSNLHLLQSMVLQESGRVSKLREHMASLRNVATSGRSQVLTLQRRRANSTALQKILEAVKRVGVAKAALDKLLAASDYTGAFAAIETMQVILDGELAGVHALRTLVRQLREMKDVIGGEMVDKFVRLATDHDDNAEKDGGAKLKHSLAPLVRGLYRKGDLRDALSKLRIKMIELIKLTSMQVVAQYAPEGQGKLLHDVDTVTFVNFLRATFEGLQHVLDRADMVHSAVKAALQTPSGKSTQQEREETKDILNASAGVVLKARDQAHSVVVRLLNFRNDVHVKLRLPDFKLIWDATMDFIATSGEPATELKAVLTKQADDFLVALDEHLTAQLKSFLEAEIWEPVVVPREFQQLVTRVEENRVLEGPNILDDVAGGPATGQGETKKIVIDDRPFRTTMASLMMVKFLVEYVRCALMFPVVAPRAAARLFDLCVMFHEQTKRLILGTEAKRNGRLNTIMAKHLALASQSLSVVNHLLPALGRVLENTVPPQQMSRVEEERLRVQELLQNHINTISDTMAGLIGAELSQLNDLSSRVDWDARGTEGLDKPHQYMVELCERINKLHTVLGNHLFPDDMDEVFERVFDLCNERVPELFAKVQPKTPIGRARVRMDVAHLLSTLGRLPRTRGPGNKLELWLDQRYGRPGGGGAAAAPPGGGAPSSTVTKPAPSE